MKTLKHSRQNNLPLMESLPMSFAEDFPAKTSALPERAPGLRASDQSSGGSSIDLLKKSARATRSLKTLQSFDLADWTQCSGRLLRSGMTRNGTVYPLQPLAPLTAGTDSGLWPTPTANPSNACSLKAGLKEAQRLHPNGFSTLWTQVAAETVHANRMWPTPDASPHKYRLKGDSQQSRSLNGIHGGKLNPQWVEWLMGFPSDWTDLKR